MCGDDEGVIGRLTEELTKLPGIGPKSAERIAHFLLAGDRRNAVLLADALRAVAEQVRPCRECFNLTDAELCPVCADPRRDAGTICVVETPRDLAILERAGQLPRPVSRPRRPAGPARRRRAGPAHLRRLARTGPGGRSQGGDPGNEPDHGRRRDGAVRVERAGRTGVPVTRLARGLPSGSSLELANAQMLADALEGRRAF